MSNTNSAGIPALIRQLTDDSRQLARDEVRLAKLEASDVLHNAGRGGVHVLIAFGSAFVALAALTVAAVAGINQAVPGRPWLGLLVVGAAELIAGWFLIHGGHHTLKTPAASLPEEPTSLEHTDVWLTRRKAAQTLPHPH